MAPSTATRPDVVGVNAATRSARFAAFASAMATSASSSCTDHGFPLAFGRPLRPKVWLITAILTPSSVVKMTGVLRSSSVAQLPEVRMPASWCTSMVRTRPSQP